MAENSIMRRPPLLPTVLTIVSIVVLCGLGSWQVQRLHWKEGLLVKLDQVYREKNPPLLSYADITRMAKSGDDFAAAKLKGRFAAAPEMLLGMRTWQGQTGYHALAVLEMPGGAVLVNRGWVPAYAKKAPLHAPQEIRHRHRHPAPGRNDANPFVPANDPAARAWYRWTRADGAGRRCQKPLAAGAVRTKRKRTQTDYPVKKALHWELSNNHLGYAGFWFGMAGVMAVIYFPEISRINRRSQRWSIRATQT